MSEQQLKNCPFCGGEAQLDSDDNSSQAIIQCTKCSVFGNPSSDREEIRNDWNRRPREQQLEAALREAKDALEYYAIDYKEFPGGAVALPPREPGIAHKTLSTITKLLEDKEGV